MVNIVHNCFTFAKKNFPHYVDQVYETKKLNNALNYFFMNQ